jgi:GntR family transcriptional regulator
MPVQAPRPQYRQVADLIRFAIDTGKYAPGSELPPEDQLARLYDVSRATINRAVLILRGEGAVRVQRGKGTVIRELPVLRREGVARQRASAARGRRAARSRPSSAGSGLPPGPRPR